MSEKDYSIYPSVSFYFKVFFKGGGIKGEAAFKEVSGLEVALGTEKPIAEGGELRFSHRLPTPPTYKNLTLRRGFVANSNLRQWIEKAVYEFEFVPITLTIILFNEKAKPTCVWVAHNVRPVKWQMSSFDSQKNELAIETLELAFDYFESKPPS